MKVKNLTNFLILIYFIISAWNLDFCGPCNSIDGVWLFGFFGGLLYGFACLTYFIIANWDKNIFK